MGLIDQVARWRRTIQGGDGAGARGAAGLSGGERTTTEEVIPPERPTLLSDRLRAEVDCGGPAWCWCAGRCTAPTPAAGGRSCSRVFSARRASRLIPSSHYERNRSPKSDQKRGVLLGGRVRLARWRWRLAIANFRRGPSSPSRSRPDFPAVRANRKQRARRTCSRIPKPCSESPVSLHPFLMLGRDNPARVSAPNWTCRSPCPGSRKQENGQAERRLAILA